MKLGLQGITVVGSAGNSGPLADELCRNGSGSRFVASHPGKYECPLISHPSTPINQPTNQLTNLLSFLSHQNSCPYITSIGATMLAQSTNGSSIGSSTIETVAHAERWASSGGFSWTFPTPDYQKDAVAAYFADHDPGRSESYNRSGRGFPDVAALGKNLAVAVLGELGVADGTSAATPLWGAMINRVNEERLAAGKGVVGFLNPVLYANPGIFRDGKS